MWRYKSRGRRAGGARLLDGELSRARRASSCSTSASPVRRPSCRTTCRRARSRRIIFNLKPGDEVTISGPYGEFFIKDTDAEMVYIGGGAGMAPLRSHIFELFKNRRTDRKVSYWYGGRSLRELFYVERVPRDREGVSRTSSFNIALSEPLARRQLDRLHRLHPPGPARRLPERPSGSRGHRILHLRSAHDEPGGVQHARRSGRREARTSPSTTSAARATPVRAVHRSWPIFVQPKSQRDSATGWSNDE